MGPGCLKTFKLFFLPPYIPIQVFQILQNHPHQEQLRRFFCSRPASHLTPNLLYWHSTVRAIQESVYLPYQTWSPQRALRFLHTSQGRSWDQSDLNWGEREERSLPHTKLKRSAYLRFPQLRPPRPNGQLQVNKEKYQELVSNLKRNHWGNLLSNF